MSKETANTVTIKKGHNFDFVALLPTQIKIDPLYQRNLQQKRIKKIFDNWNYDLVNEPKVSLRNDVKYYVFNGQHTIAAWMTAVGKDVPILCKVFHDLTWEEEKDLFVQQNGISKDPVTQEKLRAEYNGKNPEVCDMVAASAEAGIRVDFSKGNAFAKCIAVAALWSAYKSTDRKLFVKAMTMITAAWQGQAESYSQGFIKGMISLYKKYGDQIKEGEMRKSLARKTPEYYIREAADMTGSMGSRYEKLFLRAYNERRSTGRIGE